MKAFEFLSRGSFISTPDKQVILGWGPSYHVEEQKAIAFYSPDFFLMENNYWFSHEHIQRFSFEELEQQLTPYACDPIRRSWRNPHKETFRQALDELRKRIHLKELRKAVPYVFETSRSAMSPSQLAASLIHALRLARKYPLYLYGFWNHLGGMLGATPEILFTLSKTPDSWTLKTSALAGTKEKQRKDHKMESDLKTLEEHDIVIQGIRESLCHFGSLELGELVELELPNLIHLKTPITVRMQSKPSCKEIISHLHPTPALGAYPRNSGVEWLKQYQHKIERKFYGAPVGIIDPNNHLYQFCVAIRNVQWNLSEMKIGAGCGIVEGSDFDREWLEIDLKIRSIKEVFAL